MNGTKSILGAWPWAASLAVPFEDDNGIRFFCGGALISENYVLSAAHCFYYEVKPTIVRLGDLDINESSDGADYEDFIIQENIIHPE